LASLIDSEPDNIESVSLELPGAQALKEDMHSASDLAWNIPGLLEDMLAPIPPNIDSWAGRDATPDDGRSWWLWQWRPDSFRGLPRDRLMVGFYTDDARFVCVWDNPAEHVARIFNGKRR
jgi:hypothetical protein